MNVYVYHAKHPTFLDAKPPAWPSAYRRVATVNACAAHTPQEAAEHAFYVTQNLEGPWPALRAEGGVVAHADDEGRHGARARHRSTSVGDVVVIGDEAYRCEGVGWVPVKESAA